MSVAVNALDVLVADEPFRLFWPAIAAPRLGNKAIDPRGRQRQGPLLAEAGLPQRQQIADNNSALRIAQQGEPEIDLCAGVAWQLAGENKHAGPDPERTFAEVESCQDQEEQFRVGHGVGSSPAGGPAAKDFLENGPDADEDRNNNIDDEF